MALCGITSMAMIISAEKNVIFGPNLDDFFIKILNFHKNNRDSVKRKFKLNDQEIYVTLGFKDQVKAEPGDIIINDHQIFPVFILFRGYDHRASQLIFSNYGINAGLSENISTQDLVNNFNNGVYKYFMASIKSRFTDKDSVIHPTHIVVVHKTWNSDDTQMIQYIDPAEPDYEKAQTNLTFEEFNKVFNNFGTYVK